MDQTTIKRNDSEATSNIASESKIVSSSVMERVKTFEDACHELGDDNILVQHYRVYQSEMHGAIDGMKDIEAFLKLRIITAALNEGWEPQFVLGEYRFYPWFDLYTKEELDRMDKEEREEVGEVLWGGYASNGSRCGLVSAHSDYAWSLSYADIGSRLAFKSAELANYAGKQFVKIYADFCFRI